MGLDISAYCNVRLGKGEFKIHKQPFVYQLGTLKIDQEYIVDYFYGFRVGSYSSYSLWRNDVLKLFSNETYDEYCNRVWYFTEFEWSKYHREKKLNRILGKQNKMSIIDVYNEPFVELLHFSDCEGVIGPEVCKKLHEDFVKFNELAKEKMSEWFYKVYEDFMKATSGNNCVLHFH
ncbi:MAG: hypothetical protein HPY57_15165 [Ignavibacteria bacterium]|nr:hypothetical protein [Ignavibacteria bacterium]